jgi:signal transduction histidine kinase
MWQINKQQNTGGTKRLPPMQELEASAKILLRHDFELTVANNDYERQLTQLKILQEATLLANQARDHRQLFQKIGELLLTRLNYDRFFVIVRHPNGYTPYISLGFEDRPFEAKYDNLLSTGILPRFFEQPVWLFEPSEDPFASQVISIVETSSMAVAQLKTQQFSAIIGVASNEPLRPVSQADARFLLLLIGQLTVVIENLNTLLNLQRQYEQLKQLDKAKTTFLSIASHQLRTPLSVIKFAISGLNKPQNGPLTPKQTEIIHEMSKNNTRIIDLVNNLLNITRMEQGRLEVHLAPLQLGEMVQSIVHELEELIRTKQVTVAVNVPQIITVVGDPMLLREALLNLVSNGVKYNKPNGRLDIVAQSDGIRTVITFKDTGIGVPKADQSRMFSQFYRSQQAQIVDPDGIGLGMYTTRQFIRLQGGDITMESIEGSGTTFVVTLPNKLTGQPTTQPSLAQPDQPAANIVQ